MRPKRMSGKKVEALLAKGRERGYGEIPGFDWTDRCKRVYEALLEREPYHPQANRAMGNIPLEDYPDFKQVFRRMQGVKGLPEEFRAFRDKYEQLIRTRPTFRAPALPKEEFEGARRLLDRFQEWHGKLQDDPTAKAIHEARARVAIDPILGRYETVHIQVPPFVLFYASKGLVPRNESAAERARIEKEEERLRTRLRSYEALIRDYLAFYRKRWMKPLGLPEFEEDQLFFVTT